MPRRRTKVKPRRAHNAPASTNTFTEQHRLLASVFNNPLLYNSLRSLVNESLSYRVNKLSDHLLNKLLSSLLRKHFSKDSPLCNDLVQPALHLALRFLAKILLKRLRENRLNTPAGKAFESHIQKMQMWFETA